MQKKRRKD